jgi:uncharacterized protein (DUF1501 family)
MKTNRREFLQKLAAASSLAVSSFWLNPLEALTFLDEGSDHLFVHVVIEGGADGLQGLDPIMNAPTGLSNAEFWRGYSNNDIINTPYFRLGPAAEPLVPYAADMAIIRGINMTSSGSVSHEQCRARICSGMRVERGVAHSISAQFAALSQDKTIRAVLNSPAEFRTRLPVATTRLADLISSSSASNNERLLLAGQNSPLHSRESYAQSSQDVVRFHQVLAQIAPNPNMVNDHTAAAAALSSGITRCAHLNFGGDYLGAYPRSVNLDNHSDHASVHLNNQRQYWQKLADLFRLFKETPYGNTEDSLFSKTTFFISNEFSKTPGLQGNGKDHNPETNEVVLAGRGVRGGVVIGGSEFLRASAMTNNRSMLVGFPIDKVTERKITKVDMNTWQNPPTGTQLIVPEHVILTVAKILGLPVRNYRWINRPDLNPLMSVIKA